MRKIPCLTILFVIFLWPTWASAASLGLESTQLSSGSTVGIDIHVSSVNDVFAYQFDLIFNPTLLRLQTVVEGDFLSSAGSTFFIPPTIDNLAGIASFTGGSLIGFGPGASGSGSLAVFTFKALSAGTSSLDFANTEFLDSGLGDIPIDIRGGTVVVSSSTVPEPSTVWLVLAAFVVAGGASFFSDSKLKATSRATNS